MVKKKSDKNKRSSVSETKISEHKRNREKISSIVDKASKSRSQYLSFYLIKLFEKNKFDSLSKNEIVETINEIYSKNPKFFLTNTKQHYKTKASLNSSIVKLLKKICNNSKKTNSFKLNEEFTIKYLDNFVDNGDISAKTPCKAYNGKNKIKNENVSEEEDIKIKKEDIKIKEEEKEEDNEKDKDKNKDNAMEEEKEKSDYDNIMDHVENMSIEIEEEKNDKNLYELFSNRKLYDDFYLYLAEEGQFEQLQENLDKFMEIYKNNKLEEDNKLTILGIYPKIINVRTMLDFLNKNKKEYENLINEFERKKVWIKFFIEVFYVNIRTIKIMQHHQNFFDIITEAKNLYKVDKEKQNMIFDQIIKQIKEIRNVVMKSDKIKNEIIKEVEQICDLFKKNNIKYEKINEFYELVKNLLNGKYSFIIREDITENIMEKYNRCVNLLEESIDQH